MRVKLLRIDAREIGKNETITTVVNQPIHILSSEPSGATAWQRMRLLETCDALDFWSAPEEDIYSINDGEPIGHLSRKNGDFSSFQRDHPDEGHGSA